MMSCCHCAINANSTVPPVADSDTTAIRLQEVNVTLVKQQSALRESAEAGTILNAGQLERLGAVSIKGISDAVPNFFMPDYGSRITSSIYVRGIGARMDQPSVGLNVDNVPYLNKDAYDFDLSDMVSVEMLRGPQSTLYGRNTMAGVINITTLSPFRWQGVRGNAEFTSRLRGKANIGWYHLLSPTLGLSLNAGYSGAKGEFRNLYNGKPVDKEHSFSIRQKTVWRISPSWHFQNTVSAGWLRQGGYPYESVASGEINYNDTCFYRRFTFTDGLSLRYSGDKIDITSITSLQHIDDNMTLDQDFLPLDYFTLTQKKNEWGVTEDIMIKNADHSGCYNWLAGIFGFWKHLYMEAPVTFKDKGISSLIEDHRNSANWTRPVSWDSRTFPLESYFTIPTVGLAAYHESNVTLGRWTLTGGLRLDYERSVLDYNSICHTGYSIYRREGDDLIFHRHADIDIDDKGRISRHFLTLLPKLAVTMNLDDNLGNIYAKVSKGYKAGGFNTQMFSDVLQQRLMGIMGIGSTYDVDDVVGYKPEQSWNYEIGTHLDLLDRRLSLDLAAFYIDCLDQQVTTFPDGTTTGRIMANAGRTRSFGAEASMAFTLPKGFSLNCSYGYTNARFTDFFDGIHDYTGRYLPYVPRNTIFVQGMWSHRLPSSPYSISADASLKGNGKIWWNEANTLSQKIYFLLDAGVSLDSDRFSIRLWGRNLTSTRYYTFYFLSMGNEFLQRGRGIEAGVTLRLTI